MEHEGKGSNAYAAFQQLVVLDPVDESRRANVPLFRIVRPDGGYVNISVPMMRDLVC